MSPLPYPLPAPAACAPLSNQDFERLKAANPTLWTNPSTSCKTCQKTGTYRWFTDATRTEVAEYECDCRQQWLMYMWLYNAGIGLNYQRLSWDDVSTVAPNVVEEVMTYVLEAKRNIAAGRSLVLWSPGAGSGKTLLLTLALKHLMAQGYSTYFSQFNDVIDLFTDSWRDKSERAEWNRRIRNTEVVGVDDMGKEHKGRMEMVESMADQLFRARVSNALSTAITSNWTPEQIQQGYGGYVMSLMSETAAFIEVTGADFRPRRRELAQREYEMGLSRPITVV